MWLRLIDAEGLAPADQVRPLLAEANELVAIFTTGVKRLRMTTATGLLCLALACLCALYFILPLLPSYFSLLTLGVYI
jgi:hypothetical protein